jgi:hypothetical protein
MLQDCSSVVGLHPDEATEAIVDFAVRHRKPFAVVPCCVFSSKFPGRALASGEPVVTCDQLIAYLCEKDGHTEKAFLPFLGKNQVVFSKQQGAIR